MLGWLDDYQDVVAQSLAKRNWDKKFGKLREILLEKMGYARNIFMLVKLRFYLGTSILSEGEE